MRVFFSLLLLSFSVQADVIDDLKSSLKQLPFFTTQFEQVVTDNEGSVLQKATGLMQLRQPNLFRWESLQEGDFDATTLVADGNTVWYYNPFAEQVSAYSQQQMTESNPLLLLAQPDGIQWENYEVTAGKDGYMLEAKNPELQIQQLVIGFAGTDISQLTLIDLQQQTSVFRFSGFDTKTIIDDKQFVFEVPKGVEVDDQR